MKRSRTLSPGLYHHVETPLHHDFQRDCPQSVWQWEAVSGSLTIVRSDHPAEGFLASDWAIPFWFKIDIQDVIAGVPALMRSFFVEMSDSRGGDVSQLAKTETDKEVETLALC